MNCTIAYRSLQITISSPASIAPLSKSNQTEHRCSDRICHFSVSNSATSRTTFSLSATVHLQFHFSFGFISLINGKLYFRSIFFLFLSFSHFLFYVPLPMYINHSVMVAAVADTIVVVGSVRAYKIPSFSHCRRSFNNKWFILHFKWNWL